MLDINLNTTDYVVKRGTITIGNIKKAADVISFVSGINTIYTSAEIEQINNFIKTL